MRVLVTGGAGFIGSHTVRWLADAGHDVAVLDSLEHGHPAAIPDIALRVGDIRDGRLVAEALDHHRTEAVVHFAARKSVSESIADPGAYFDVNVGGTLSLLRAMRQTGVERLVVSSTCAVYGNPELLPVVETSPTKPENPYGESKLAMERMAAWFQEAHGIRTVALRYFNAAGASLDGSNGEVWDRAQNLVPVVLKVAAGQADVVDVFGTDYPTPDGTAIRDYVHVLDLADAHARALTYLMDGGASTTLNVGTGRGASVFEVIEAARATTGRPIHVRPRPRRPGDPVAIWADGRAAREVLGWRPSHDLDSIVSSAWRWHVAHPGGHGPLPTTGDQRVGVGT